jgi:hypothetical protein
MWAISRIMERNKEGRKDGRVERPMERPGMERPGVERPVGERPGVERPGVPALDSLRHRGRQVGRVLPALAHLPPALLNLCISTF